MVFFFTIFLNFFKRTKYLYGSEIMFISMNNVFRFLGSSRPLKLPYLFEVGVFEVCHQSCFFCRCRYLSKFLFPVVTKIVSLVAKVWFEKAYKVFLRYKFVDRRVCELVDILLKYNRSQRFTNTCVKRTNATYL